MGPLDLHVLSDALVRTSAYAPLVLFFGSLVEYVFPPFPGDTLVLLGAWYAVGGHLSWPMTFVAVTAGALVGGYVDYAVGAALGRSLDRSAARRSPLTAARLARFEAAYRRWGAWLLVANRFLPGVRAFLFLGAGAAAVPLPRVLFFGGLSAALWNALLLAAGALLVRNAEELAALAAHYSRVAWAVMALVAAALAARALWRRRRPGGEP